MGRVATMLTTAASQRVRGQRLRTERGANRGRVGVEDCACDRSNSEQGMGAERRARGLPRERAGCTEQQQLAAVVMLAASGVGAAEEESVARLLARNGCREYGVARWPLAGGRAGPTFEDEASPATRY